MLYSDRILSDVESIHLSPKKGRFEVEGLDPSRRPSDKGFEMAPILADKVIRDHERRMRLAIHSQQIRMAKKLMHERRRKASAPYRVCKRVGALAHTSGLMNKGREAIFLFLITGVVFQVGIICHNMGLIGH